MKRERYESAFGGGFWRKVRRFLRGEAFIWGEIDIPDEVFSGEEDKGTRRGCAIAAWIIGGIVLLGILSPGIQGCLHNVPWHEIDPRLAWDEVRAAFQCEMPGDASNVQAAKRGSDGGTYYALRFTTSQESLASFWKSLGERDRSLYGPMAISDDAGMASISSPMWRIAMRGERPASWWPEAPPEGSVFVYYSPYIIDAGGVKMSVWASTTHAGTTEVYIYGEWHVPEER